MLSYPNELPFRRLFRFSFALALLVAAAASLSAQRQLMVPNPFDLESKLEVLAFEESLCVVDLGAGVERIAARSYFFESAASFADGYLELNRPVGRVVEGNKKVSFEFSAKVRPSRDYTDCFVVLQLFAQDGREFLLPFEIDDLQAGKAQQVRIAPELAITDLDRGIYHYHFFSGGNEIYFAPTSMALGKRNHRPLPLRNAGCREPELVAAPQQPLPASMAWMVSDEEVLVAVGVNDSGFSVDHTLLSETNPSAAKLALDLVKKSRFRPGSENGFYARKDLLLKVRFDSRGGYQLTAL
ncbi:hypothetical protein [Pelagicoccus sp. SDUM812005]|uniref:hypothetical protein n=1 Tax=Pelagicoccus sp. SDUM812005 TaxID=3041257 RepID=UPI00280FA99C|nr:hypothetical protein [Pelagicoccus sp. SDUM812005]MDQ8182384.1 hypothetical protein [Pelagicoccus sp. SDUM812005]